MERKNMILLTVIGAATLLVAMVGATFAFFTATVEDKRSSDSGTGTANIIAGSVASKTVVGNVSGDVGKFTAKDVYPGHREVAGLSVTVTNEGETANTNTNIDLVYNVTKNTFANKEIVVNVYKKVGEDPNVQANYFGCSHDVQAQDADNEFHFTETCTNTLENFESNYSLTKITEKPVELDKGTSENLVIASDTISAEEVSGTKTVYYYVVVEFKNDPAASQNESMNAELEGTINVKAA